MATACGFCRPVVRARSDNRPPSGVAHFVHYPVACTYAAGQIAVAVGGGVRRAVARNICPVCAPPTYYRAGPRPSCSPCSARRSASRCTSGSGRSSTNPAAASSACGASSRRRHCPRRNRHLQCRAGALGQSTANTGQAFARLTRKPAGRFNQPRPAAFTPRYRLLNPQMVGNLSGQWLSVHVILNALSCAEACPCWLFPTAFISRTLKSS